MAFRGSSPQADEGGKIAAELRGPWRGGYRSLGELGSLVPHSAETVRLLPKEAAAGKICAEQTVRRKSSVKARQGLDGRTHLP